MQTNIKCSLYKHLEIVPGCISDYEHLARFHYCGSSPGPTRKIYKIIEDHLWRSLAAPVVGIIIYAAPAANLAARNRAIGGLLDALDRSTALSLLNERMSCIRRVIIEPRYRGLGLASWLVRETLPLAGFPMVEAVSMMGRSHPFFERAGMRAFEPPSDPKTERMIAALETTGLNEALRHDSESVHALIESLGPAQQMFLKEEMARFCQKFTNRRNTPHGPERTDFILNKLSPRPLYYLWTHSDCDPGT